MTPIMMKTDNNQKSLIIAMKLPYIDFNYVPFLVFEICIVFMAVCGQFVLDMSFVLATFNGAGYINLVRNDCEYINELIKEHDECSEDFSEITELIRSTIILSQSMQR